MDNSGRGAGIVDLNTDGKLDLVYTNWLGPTRVFQIPEDNQIQMTDYQVSSFFKLESIVNLGYLDSIKSLNLL